MRWSGSCCSNGRQRVGLSPSLHPATTTAAATTTTTTTSAGQEESVFGVRVREGRGGRGEERGVLGSNSVKTGFSPDPICLEGGVNQLFLACVDLSRRCVFFNDVHTTRAPTHDRRALNTLTVHTHSLQGVLNDVHTLTFTHACGHTRSARAQHSHCPHTLLAGSHCPHTLLAGGDGSKAETVQVGATNRDAFVCLRCVSASTRLCVVCPTCLCLCFSVCLCVCAFLCLFGSASAPCSFLQRSTLLRSVFSLLLCLPVCPLCLP